MMDVIVLDCAVPLSHRRRRRRRSANWLWTCAIDWSQRLSTPPTLINTNCKYNPVLRHMARVGDFREAFLCPDLVTTHGGEDGIGFIR